MLNKREKRKLKELAERARSTFEIRDSMKATQEDAVLEIQEMLSLFDETLKGTSDSRELAVPFSNSNLRETLDEILDEILSGKSGFDKEFRNSANDSSNSNHDSNDRNESSGPDINDVPEWVRKLKREIAKKCHPDAIARTNLSALENFRRSEYFSQVEKAYQESNWDEILLIGVYLDLFPDSLPSQNQKLRITRCFQKASSEVNEIRKSIGYKWSENWNDYELKWTVLEFYMAQKGMNIPDKIAAIKKIKEYENSLE